MQSAELSFPRVLGILVLAGALVAAGASDVQAQDESATVVGTVQTADGAPAQGVNVRLEDTQLGSVTDEDGRYEIVGVEAGAYALVVSSVGLETHRQEITARAGRTTEVDPITLNRTVAELQELIVTAPGQDDFTAEYVSPSLHLQSPLIETPQNIQVVTGSLLEEQQATTTRDQIVRNVSGASRGEHWGHFARIYMRGSRIPAFRNGMNISSAWGPLAQDASMIDRVEFVKGPAGFMMANGEPGGFYNVVTEKPTGATRRSASLSFGSFESYRATMDLDGRLDEDGTWLYRLNLMGENQNTHIQHDYHDRYAISPVVTYNLSPRTSITAEYTYQFAEYLSPGAGYQFSAKGYEDVPRNFTIADPELDPTAMTDHSGFLYLNHRLSPNWNLTGKVAYFDYRVDGTSLWPASLDSSGTMVRGQSIWDSRLENKQGQLFVRGNVATGSVGHQVLAGLDMGDKHHLADFGQWRALASSQPFNIYDPAYGIIEHDSMTTTFDYESDLRGRATWDEEQRHTALYVQDELRFWGDRLRLTLAGRFTDSKDNEVTEQVFTPRAGLNVGLTPSHRAYALYDEAFLPQAGATAEGESFDPIRGHIVEGGLKSTWLGGRLQSTLSFYRIMKNNVLTSDPENPQFQVQLGETRTQGAEVDVRGRLAPGLQVVANYAYTDSEVTEDTDPNKEGDHMSGTAKHTTNSWISYRVQKGSVEGLGLSLGHRWQVDRYAWVFTGGQQPLPDYFRLDGGLSWRGENVEIALKVNNLLDEYLFSGRYYTFGDYYYWKSEAPRNFRLRIGYSF